jgi:hypothetical protein
LYLSIIAFSSSDIVINILWDIDMKYIWIYMELSKIYWAPRYPCGSARKP